MREVPTNWRDWRPQKREGMREGRRVELDTFGAVRKTADFDYVMRQLADRRGYVTFRQAMDLVRSYTRQDPTRPEKPFAKELRQDVCEFMRLPVPAWDSVRFYTAIDTPLDRFHHTDGWIEYVDPRSGERAFVTMDVTLDPAKIHEWISATQAQEEYFGANIVVMNPADQGDDYFDRQVREYAQLVASRLSARMQESGLRRPIPFPSAGRRVVDIPAAGKTKNRPSR